jgi:hypothetical protein
VDAEYIDIDTGATALRTYYRAGALLSVDDIPLTNDLTVRSFDVKLSQLDQATIDLVRGYDMKLARLEVHRGLFDPGTNKLVAPLFPRALAIVDDCAILDPAEKNDGQVTLSCVSDTRELTRSNSDVRSDASQQNRHTGDRFYKYTAVAGSWQVFWGTKRGKIAPASTSVAIQQLRRTFGGGNPL